jgi:hypothetical protein
MPQQFPFQMYLRILQLKVLIFILKFSTKQYGCHLMHLKPIEGSYGLIFSIDVRKIMLTVVVITLALLL